MAGSSRPDRPAASPSSPAAPLPTSGTATLAHRLAVIPFALFLAYGAAVLAASLPPSPLDPTWQLRLSAALVDNAALPLVGLVLLHLGIYLHPGGRLQARRDAAARWAIAAALGFLLLVPLQAVAAWRAYSGAERTQSNQLSSANRRIAAMRQAIAAATSPEDLQIRLRAAQAPPLAPAALEEPLPRLRQRLLATLEQAERRVGDRFRGLNPTGVWELAQRSVRVTVCSLGYALAFAAGAQRRNCEVSLLQEWQRARSRRSQYKARG